MLPNAEGVGGCQISLKKALITKMYGSTLFALRGGGYKIPRKKDYVTVAWPPKTEARTDRCLTGVVFVEEVRVLWGESEVG